MSTKGARSSSAAPSAWATQPATTSRCSSPPAARRSSRAIRKPAELGVDLLGRLLADVAGIEDDEIGSIGIRHGRIAVPRQQAGHPLAVVDIHLTAIGLDVHALGRAERRWGLDTVACGDRRNAARQQGIAVSQRSQLRARSVPLVGVSTASACMARSSLIASRIAASKCRWNCPSVAGSHGRRNVAGSSAAPLHAGSARRTRARHCTGRGMDAGLVDDQQRISIVSIMA